jgi:hypothetical protein
MAEMNLSGNICHCHVLSSFNLVRGGRTNELCPFVAHLLLMGNPSDINQLPWLMLFFLSQEKNESSISF